MRSAECGMRSAEWRIAFVAGLLGAWGMLPSGLAAQESTQNDVRAKVLTQARSALVDVELFLKLPADDDEIGPGGAGETIASQLQERQQEQVARDKKSIELMGVVLSPREVVVPDTGIDPRRLDRWEVIDSAGRRTPARRTSILMEAPGIVLEPVDTAAAWQPPQFADAKVDESNTLTIVSPQRVDGDWVMGMSSLRAAGRWSSDNGPSPANSFWNVGASGGGVSTEALLGGGPRASAAKLVFTSRGELLGAALADRIYAGLAAPPWRAADLRAAPRLGVDEWNKIQQRTRDQVGALLYPVRIEYRRPRGRTQGYPDSELLGWAIADRTLIIPHAIHRKIAAVIDRITIDVGGRKLDGEFIGQLRDFDAFLVGLAKDAESLPAFSDLKQAGELTPYRPHIAMTVNRRYGANDLRIDYTRKLGATRGYANRLGPQFVPAPSLGSLVLDLNGKPIGFFSRRRRPKEELEPYEQTQSAQLPGSQRTSSAELFALADWASALTDPASYVDPQVVRLDEKQEGRRAWLGVEFSPLTKDLAESLGCRRESKDGRLGLMISQIYAGSPAEQVGLRTGDVILGVDVPGRPRTIDLAPGRRGSSTPDLSQLMSQGDGARSASSRAPWPSQENYLTTLLDIVGADTTVKLSVWRGGKLEHIETRVTQAPPDQDSAEQFKDEEIGLTVKEVTYEVRAALRLKPDDPGVVVARVESGAPAGRARINAFEIIQSADGEPINSPAEFGEIINKARAEKKDQVRLVVVDRGRSRFADLKMGQ